MARVIHGPDDPPSGRAPPGLVLAGMACRTFSPEPGLQTCAQGEHWAAEPEVEAAAQTEAQVKPDTQVAQTEAQVKPETQAAAQTEA